MNKWFLMAMMALVLVISALSAEAKGLPGQYPGKLKGSTIYEVNIRQHTIEGTFDAFARDLGRLHELGVDVLWLMPVQPIGIKARKGELGSYYSIRDYRQVNEEFGTREALQQLIKQAHSLGMSVILDWVPNHTAWDHPWVKEHPEYYAKNARGEIIYESDWTDIALLDHTNPATRLAMIDEMRYWIEEMNIDGFRCDHAGHEIPMYFWEQVRATLDPANQLFWLAEWDGARMHLQFHATYAWQLLHLTHDIAQGKATADDLAKWVANDLGEYGQIPFRMTMLTNHDENAWNGTVFERYGDAIRPLSVFIFTGYGIPMLYSGQEAGLNKALSFFTKDQIDWSDPLGFQPFYRQLVKIHRDNPALWAGQFGGLPVRINTDKHIYAYKREVNGNRVITVINFHKKAQMLHVSDDSVFGQYTDELTGKGFTLSEDQPLELLPWQALVFVDTAH